MDPTDHHPDIATDATLVERGDVAALLREYRSLRERVLTMSPATDDFTTLLRREQQIRARLMTAVRAPVERVGSRPIVSAGVPDA